MKTEIEILKMFYQSFIGYGDPINSVIFSFGLEEKEVVNSTGDNNHITNLKPEISRLIFSLNKLKDNEDYCFYGTNELYDFDKELERIDFENAKSSQIYPAIKIIYNQYFDNNIIENNSEIGSTKKQLFHGNIFNYPTANHREQEELKNERVNLLFSFFHKYIFSSSDKKIIITFGEIDKMKEIFNSKINTSKFEEKHHNTLGKSNLYYEMLYVNCLILLLNHPSHSWLTKEQQHEVGIKIKCFLNPIENI